MHACRVQTCAIMFVAITFGCSRSAPRVEPEPDEIERASRAAPLVEVIEVMPRSLSLAVGDSVSLTGTETLRWVAKDHAGNEVRDFRPLFSLSNTTIVRLDSGSMRALKRGQGDLLVSAARLHPGSLRPAILRTTKVRLVVH